MKVASYIFYALAVLAALAGIAAASFAKDSLGQVFGSGALIFYGSATVISGLIGYTCQKLAERKY
jgi:hypothetical protein